MPAATIIHAGFIRTATTTLQEAVFRHLPDVNYLGRPFVNRDVGAAIESVFETDGVRYDAAHVRSVIANHLDPARITLLSYENLASFKARDKKLTAARLKAIFPEARVIFTIRNQRDLIRSWYLFQRMPPRRYASFDAWWKRAEDHLYRGVLDDINFDDTIRAYERQFGADHVGVFTYEMLRDHPARFARRVADFTGLDSDRITNALKKRRLNRGATTRHLTSARLVEDYVPQSFARWMERVMPEGVVRRLHRWQAAGAKPQVSFTPAQEALISALCARGNRRLARRRRLPLAELGYPM